ncbi:hypothetical protein [Sporosarcina limicola]|uniref:Uncharacterized protein n=1 Tax=Sporosarcina limicola TaxID=34101 RepID=A0A927MN75_9BACL|nr:hypothetical protein [Sporosarcina limicola]MBE1557106.1 hypothetical protein [Sporosarcina limicola]
MFKKKFFSFFVCITFLLASTNVHAESISECDILPESAKSLPSSGEFSPVKNTVSTLATNNCVPLYRYKVKHSEPFWGGDNAFATSESFKNCNGTVSYDSIEMVYAKAKLYKYGAFLTSAEDTTNHGFFAGARATNTESTTSGLASFGEHKFKKQGYMEHNLFTYVN